MNATHHNLLEQFYKAALCAADPASAIDRMLHLSETRLFVSGVPYDLGIYRRLVIIGAGKASARMSSAVERIMRDRISGGIVIVKHGQRERGARLPVVEAGHPVPDAAGVAATREIMKMLEPADARTLVLCLLSGGGSALLVSPAPGLTLEDKQRTTDLLLLAGASIDELNVVRKHLSAVKGGRMAKIAYPATVLSLILSDVIGDRLDVIASGPTAPDSSTYADAVAVIEKYQLQDKLPRTVVDFLERGLVGQEPETVRAADPCFARTQNIIIGSNRLALVAARDEAERFGFRTRILSSELSGEARDAGSMLAEHAVRLQTSLAPGERSCILAGGETTVTVRGAGRGGRNQELALAFALEIEGIRDITLLSAGTDGTDGPTDAAGAVVDGATAEKARAIGLAPEEYLANNDSYTFFSRLDALTGEQHHLITGPTGTNVMDLQLVLIERP